SPLVDDPQYARWARRLGCGECDPVAERAKLSRAELDELISTELVAVDLQRGGVEEQAVVGVRGQQLGRRDDGAPAVRLVDPHIERHARAQGNCALEAGRFHGATEVETQVRRWIDPALAVGRI